ncbi:hypothetical protein PCJ32_29075, partial [Klebsiella pneumoniae]|uniref:hypothetical protein n=1 Tax=Klebsiella pneumoniae TaxID=573 RepID=UPI0023AFC707
PDEAEDADADPHDREIDGCQKAADGGDQGYSAQGPMAHARAVGRGDGLTRGRDLTGPSWE